MVTALLLLSLFACPPPKPDDTADTQVEVPDADSDGYDASQDCDDDNSRINPGAREVCDGVDNDCDTLVDADDDSVTDAGTWYGDGDGDGFGDGASPAVACDQPEGTVADATDCDDADGTVNVLAPEVCDGQDNNCNGATDEGASVLQHPDADGDGYGDQGLSDHACAGDPGWTLDGTDCDDGDPTVHPTAPEICDGVDQDCNGGVDDNATDAPTWYADDDDDAYGDPASPKRACVQPLDHVADSSDCDDRLATVNPGASELCNGRDDNCDGGTDEDSATDATWWYTDLDVDGYGDPSTGYPSCSWVPGTVNNSGDCDDALAAVHPGALEVCDDVDQDCDGTADEGALDATAWYDDADGDSYGDAGHPSRSCAQPDGTVADFNDCDDTNPAVNPAALERCNGVDDDCDGASDEAGAEGEVPWYKDWDHDGFGDAADWSMACAAPDMEHVADSTDCDDTNGRRNPGAEEVCDEWDNDCDGEVNEGAPDAPTWWYDADGDLFGGELSLVTCTWPGEGWIGGGEDCDDRDPAVYPFAAEACDDLDNDCNGLVDDGATGGTWYADLDGDSYGDAASPTTACAGPEGTVADATDCDDTLAGVNPGATETCDDVDNDCNGLVDDGAGAPTPWYADLDGDSYGDAASPTTACTAPEGSVADGTDCDDSLAEVNPGAMETCDDVDNDCNGLVDDGVTGGTWYADLDGDSYGDAASPTTACTAPEGAVADATDCDDTVAEVNPGAAEALAEVDDDCDGLVDEDQWTRSDTVGSELLADFPAHLDSEFFEIYNASSRVLYLDHWLMSAWDLYVSPSTGESWETLRGQFRVAPGAVVLDPGAYAVFCYSDAVLGSDCDYVWGSDVNAPSTWGATWSADFVLSQEATEGYHTMITWSPTGEGMGTELAAGTTAPWPVREAGHSIEACLLTPEGIADPASWVVSTAPLGETGLYGTPGDASASCE